MDIEAGKSYIQLNPYLGRKVLHVERLRESVWGWNLCDVTVVHLDDVPKIEHRERQPSTIYDDQGLLLIPDVVYTKIRSLAMLYEATARAAGQERVQPQANETLANCLRVLAEAGIIDGHTYTQDSLLAFAVDYERFANAQMQRITDIIDVHK